MRIGSELLSGHTQRERETGRQTARQTDKQTDGVCTQWVKRLKEKKGKCIKWRYWYL